MDISSMSILMNQGRVQTAVQLSVLKLGMDSGKEIANQMTEMMSSMSVEPGKGINIDRIV